MTDTSREISIEVRVSVMLRVTADEVDGEIVVTDVRNVELPSATEVMEALDADQQFDELGRLYAEAGEAK